ncbi:alpha/beta hydrolase [Streptomyces sp. DT24]|uniref:alpha/beta hydrolase n=1 Tax=unclassified Streptomyces TaxID=2593676 RepID=UPI0023B94C93|nr:alpha/beta hydrolase [Streptomyces sp. AM 4-1-1]WEH32294.1 alpha/beta hydrolase [Streptomyces sp. AM 4-1-1]
MSRAQGPASADPDRLTGESALDLFLRPQGRSRVRPDERAVVESARTDEMTVNGDTVVSYRWGSGKRPVLLVHGWESRASRYAKAIARLVELGFSPVAFDAPGHGESTGSTTTLVEYRDIIVELHREHGDFEAVVAHSFGATAAFVSLRHGVRARRMVSISAVPDFAYLIDTFCARLELSPELKEELRGRVEREAYPTETDMWTRFSVFHESDRLRIPVLVVHDEDDTRVDPAEAGRLAAAFGDRARLVTTRRFGHQRILGAPQVVSAIAEFVSTGAVGTGQEVRAG